MRVGDRDRVEKAEQIFRNHGGILRTSEAIRAGIHPRTLYKMRHTGVIEKLARGLYRLADLPPLSNPDMVAVALKVPKGVICLVSALAYHDLTTQIPHEVYVALERGMEKPRLEHPPIRFFWYSQGVFREGIESGEVDGGVLRVYNAEKTLADCFKYRNKIGLDIAVEGLQLYREGRGLKVDRILHFARVCRVENVMRPYLEALL